MPPGHRYQAGLSKDMVLTELEDEANVATLERPGNAAGSTELQVC